MNTEFKNFFDTCKDYTKRAEALKDLCDCNLIGKQQYLEGCEKILWKTLADVDALKKLMVYPE